MDSISWLWHEVRGNFLWTVILSVSFWVFTKIRPRLKTSWQWTVGLFRKKVVPTPAVIAEAPRRDGIGVWFLVIAILLLALWNRSLERDNHILHVEMVRYVLPRELTKQQIEEVGKYLASHSQPHEVKIRFVMNDNEAKEYGNDFAAAFRAGNWLPIYDPVNPFSITCQTNATSDAGQVSAECTSKLLQQVSWEGDITVVETGPTLSPPSTLQEKLNPPPSLPQVVSDAFRASGVDVSSGGSILKSDSSTTLTLSIGPRPRDRTGILPERFWENQRKKQKSPQQLTDDDF
jgi:hypothetical protein